MKYLSIRNAQSLYWIGRYLQRFGIVAKEAIRAFDFIIDTNQDEGRELYEKMGFSFEYTNADDFFHEVVLGKHDGSLLFHITQARENMIAIRDIIEDDAFAMINTIYIQLDKEPRPTPQFIENLLRELYGFWGLMFLKTIRNKSQLFLEFGRMVEAIDLKLRLFEDISMVLFDIANLNHIGHEITSDYQQIVVHSSDIETLLKRINEKIGYIICYEN